MSIENLSCKVTPKYMVWRAKKVEDMVIPPEMEDVQFRDESPKVPSELESLSKHVKKRRRK